MTKRYFPEKFNLVTSADETAMLSDIDRISGESLFDYKKRILESSKRLASSSYQGLINAINRELGLTQREIVKVEFKNILEGDLEDNSISYTDFIITDNRSYAGTVNGTSTKIVGNKFVTDLYTWPLNYLAGLKITFDSKTYKILSNTESEVVLDSTPTTLHVGENFSIESNLIVNSLIGYGLTLDGDKYEIIANTAKTITVNKPLKYQDSSLYSIVLNRPRVKITSSRIIFYKEYLNEENYQLELTIDLRNNNLTHRSLCKLVNTESQFFKMTDLIPLESEIKAFTFKQKDSDIKIFEERVPASKFFKLKNKDIKPGTLSFSESNIFSKEEDELNDELFGPYYSVNHKEGVVQSTMLPNGTGQVSYTYMDFPFTLDHAPAVVVGLSDKESEHFLFSQKEKIIYDDPRERFVSGQPTAEMIEYIAELLRVNRQSWGI